MTKLQKIIIYNALLWTTFYLGVQLTNGGNFLFDFFAVVVSWGVIITGLASFILSPLAIWQFFVALKIRNFVLGFYLFAAMLITPVFIMFIINSVNSMTFK